MAPTLEVSVQQLEYNTIDLSSLSSKEPTFSITSVPSTPSTPTEYDALSDSTIVLDPSLITQDFDLLRFEAAACDQLPSIQSSVPASQETKTNHSTPGSPTYSNLLISSPYNNQGHYLDLTTLPLPSLLFAKALTALRPLTPSYATAPYTEALNFSTVLSVLRSLLHQSHPDYHYPETSFYVVTFRSQLHPNINNTYLYQLDYESHREACESGGLLKYWFGKADGERRNLATCFWHSREDAHRGGLGPWHVKARRAGRELYEQIVFSTLRFTVEEGARGWRVGEWVD